MFEAPSSIARMTADVLAGESGVDAVFPDQRQNRRQAGIDRRVFGVYFLYRPSKHLIARYRNVGLFSI